MEFSKSERRQLRDLAGSVYEAEAHRMLEGLDSDFEKWRKGEFLSSDLLASIHQFHQHPSRELWSMYQGLGDSAIVVRGLALGLIEEPSVPPALLAKLEPLRAMYQGNVAQ
jgi:hypothetical protein